jgi:flagellar basal body-associated protein FliL
MSRRIFILILISLALVAAGIIFYLLHQDSTPDFTGKYPKQTQQP